MVICETLASCWLRGALGRQPEAGRTCRIPVVDVENGGRHVHILYKPWILGAGSNREENQIV